MSQTNAGRAKLEQQLPVGIAGGVAMGDEPDEFAVGLRKLHALAFEGEQQAFEAAAEADAGRRAAAERFDEVVVASAAADGVLRAQAAGGDFPQGVGVVVEAADEIAIDA